MRRVMPQLLLVLLLPSTALAEIRLDRVAALVPAERFDGSAESPALNAAGWRQLLHQLRMADDAPARWGRTPDEARRLAGHERLIELAVLDVDHSDGSLFAAAALRDHSYHGADLRFVLRREWYVGEADPIGLQIDLDDGRGWRTLQFERALDAHYESTGPRTLRLRAATRHGVQKARIEFEVLALATPAPDDTLRVTGAAYQGVTSSGEAYVLRAPGHATIQQPAIVIEGFDLDDTLNWEELYTLLNQESLVEDLRAEGFDAIVLNFDVATEPIQRNGLLVAELITQIRAMTSEPIALVGASMGGLCSRYALLELEDQGFDHGVSTFISFDTPHGGANIPLGVQHWLDFFQDRSTEAAFLLSRLDTPAARQMLVLHHSATSGNTAAPDPLRASFQTDLAALGGYPVGPRLVAVANGSGTQMNQGFAPAAKLIDWYYSSLGTVVRGDVYALADQTLDDIFVGQLTVFFIPLGSRTVSIAGARPWDGAPGGRRNSLQQMDEVVAPYGDIIANYPNHCFIPTISALDIATGDPFYDVAGDVDLLAHVPFDAVYFPSENQDHVAVTPESKLWFLDEITPLATPAPPARAAAALRLDAHPNPFNPALVLSFELESPRPVSLEIFDARGRRVALLLDGATLSAGAHELRWQPALGSGVYRVRLRAAEQEIVRSVSLLK